MKQINKKIKISNNLEIKNDVSKKEIILFLLDRITTFQEIIKKTIISVQKYKFLAKMNLLSQCMG